MTVQTALFAPLKRASSSSPHLLSSHTLQLLAALLFGPARCLCWAAYFHFLATESRYAADLTARAMGYNNVAIAVAGAAGPYVLTHLVASLTATEGDRYHDVKVMLQVCGRWEKWPSMCGRRNDLTSIVLYAAT